MRKREDLTTKMALHRNSDENYEAKFLKLYCKLNKLMKEKNFRYKIK